MSKTFVEILLEKTDKIIELHQLPPLIFEDYGFTEEELLKVGPVLEYCKKSSELFFWQGYKEALETINKKV